MQPSVATRTAFSHALLVLLVLGTLQAAHGQGSSQVRDPLPVPDAQAEQSRRFYEIK